MSDSLPESPPTQKNRPSLFTLLDYAILIALAVVIASFTVYYLTQRTEQISDRPNPRLSEILKS